MSSIHEHKESDTGHGHLDSGGAFGKTGSDVHTKGHSHSHAPHLPGGDYLNRAFILGIILNIGFVVAELVAGLILGSVALISDAGHNLSDVVGLALALAAFRLARRKPTDKFTYGHKKSTVVVSLVNACILLVAVGFIVYESILKLIEPEPIQGSAVAWVAGIGILINGFTAWLFLRHKDKDLNVKGAYLHMAADTLVSVGVLISGIVISFTGWYILDPIIGIVIAVVIFLSTWGLLTESVRLSLDGVPSGIDAGAIGEIIRRADSRIEDVHHIHIWALSTTETALTTHIRLAEGSPQDEIRNRVKEALQENGICHATIETETGRGRCHECGCGQV